MVSEWGASLAVVGKVPLDAGLLSEHTQHPLYLTLFYCNFKLKNKLCFKTSCHQVCRWKLRISDLFKCLMSAELFSFNTKETDS